MVVYNDCVNKCLPSNQGCLHAVIDIILYFFLSVSPERRLWNRLYCAIVSANIGVISSLLGGSVQSNVKACINTESASVLQEKNESMEETTKSGVLEIEINDSVRSEDEGNKTSDDLKTDSNINRSVKCTKTDTIEELVSSGISNEFEDSPSRNGELSSARILDVINEQFGEGGDTLLHVASRSSRREIVLRLLECGSDPAVK